MESKIRVRYKETDQMGIAHHSNYYPWFEVARTELMRAKGLTYREMEERGLMLPLVETHCRYRQGAKYDDLLTIRCFISQFNGVRLTVEYEVIRDEDGALIAQGKTVHAVTNRELKPVNLRKADPEIYELFMSCL